MRNIVRYKRASSGLYLSLRSLELVGVTIHSSGHSQCKTPWKASWWVAVRFCWEWCLHTGTLLCSVVVALLEFCYFCRFWCASCLASDKNVLAGEKHWKAQPCSAPGLRARLPFCPMTTQLLPLHKHTPTHKAAGLSSSDCCWILSSFCAQLLSSGNVVLWGKPERVSQVLS